METEMTCYCFQASRQGVEPVAYVTTETGVVWSVYPYCDLHENQPTSVLRLEQDGDTASADEAEAVSN